MKIMNLLLIILPLISGICLTHAFAEVNALWGLPPGATNRIGKGRVNRDKVFSGRYETCRCKHHRYLDLRCRAR